MGLEYERARYEALKADPRNDAIAHGLRERVKQEIQRLEDGIRRRQSSPCEGKSVIASYLEKALRRYWFNGDRDHNAVPRVSKEASVCNEMATQ